MAGVVAPTPSHQKAFTEFKLDLSQRAPGRDMLLSQPPFGDFLGSPYVLSLFLSGSVSGPGQGSMRLSTLGDVW